MKTFSDVPYWLVLFAAQSFGTTGPKRGNVQRFKRSVTKNCKRYDRTASMKSMISNTNACGAQVLVPRSHHGRSGREEQGQKHVAHPQAVVIPLWIPYGSVVKTMPFAPYKSPSHYHQWVMIESIKVMGVGLCLWMTMDDHPAVATRAGWW